MTPAPALFVLRHGETEWNRAGRFQGRQESPLTEIGHQQAAAQGAILRALNDSPRDIYVSPLGRTLETARIALGADAAFVTDDRLQEIDFGTWEGRTRSDIRAEIGKDYDKGHWNFASPGGESFEDIRTRVAGFLADLTGPSILVTHGTTSVVLRGLCLGLDQEGMLGLSKEQGCVFHLSNGQETILR